MQNILVTGAAGFIGFHLCEKFLEKGYTVVGIDNINDYYDVELKYSRLKELGIVRNEAEYFNQVATSTRYSENFKFVRINLEDKENLTNLFHLYKFDVVCNLAAQAGVRYSLENPKTYIDSNIVGFLNLLECCRHNKIKHLMYASSSSVYGENKKIPFSVGDNVDHPISLYAATKKSNELMAYTYSHLYGIPTSGLRFFTVYGPWGRPDMAMFLFTDAIINGRPIKVFNEGRMQRDFTFIDDIVDGMEIILSNPPQQNGDKPPYIIRNIGNGSPESLLDFINALEESLCLKAQMQFLPMQPGDVPRTWADMTDLENLGYKSKTNMSKGIAKFVEWYKKYYSIKA